MSETHLNDISKVYLDQVAEADSLAAMQARREKRLAAQRKREGTTSTGRDFGRDDSLSADQQKKRRDAEFKSGMKKEEVEAVDEAMSSYDRNRKRAAQRAAERNAARAAGKTGVVPGVGYVSPRKERETYVDSAGTTRHKSGAKMESLDPVGQEDGDVNNDGKKDSSDKYLMKRREAIAKAIKKKVKKEEVEHVEEGKFTASKSHIERDGTAPAPARTSAERKKDRRILAGYGKGGMEMAVDRAKKERDEKRASRRVKMESFSDWRTELSEVIGDTDVKKKSETPKIKEGSVNNASKIKINPEIKEAVEEIGGTLLEMVEIDEMDYILESVYDELIEEGFAEEDVEFGIEQALVQDLEEVTSPAAVASAKMRSGNGNPKRDAGAEARSRMNISSSKPSQETKKPSFKDRLKSAAKNAIIGAGRAVGSMMKKKAQAQKSVGKVGSYIDRAKKLARQGYEQGRGPVEKKTTYRGAGVGRKEKIGEDLVNEQDAAPNEKQMLAKKKQMMLKQQMIDKQRLQMQQQGKLPTGHRTEELSIADQMKISREAAAKRKPYQPGDREKQRAAQMRSAAKKVKKDTRTDAERMTDATGPRPGSRYRGD